MAQWAGLYKTSTAPLKRGKTAPNECPWYDTKQFDSEAPVMQEIWGMRSTRSLSVSLWFGLVAPDKFLSMG